MIGQMVSAPAAPAVDGAATAIRVLIVDNDEPHAQAVAESLARVGYDCTVATSGAAGAERIGSSTSSLPI